MLNEVAYNIPKVIPNLLRLICLETRLKGKQVIMRPNEHIFWDCEKTGLQMTAVISNLSS